MRDASLPIVSRSVPLLYLSVPRVQVSDRLIARCLDNPHSPHHLARRDRRAGQQPSSSRRLHMHRA